MRRPTAFRTSRSWALAKAWMRALKRCSKSSKVLVLRAVCRAMASTMASRFFERCDSSRMISRTCASRSSRSFSCCSSALAVETKASSALSSSGTPVRAKGDRLAAQQPSRPFLDCGDRSGDAPRRPERQQHARQHGDAAGQAGEHQRVADRALEHLLLRSEAHHPAAEAGCDMGVGDLVAVLAKPSRSSPRAHSARRCGSPRTPGLPTVLSWSRERAMKFPLRSIRPPKPAIGQVLVVE